MGAGEEMVMAQEKHRGAPKKQQKKQSAQAKAKAAKKAAARQPVAPQEQS